MEDHYDGITPDQRYRNDVLNELRQIRQLLERNGQTLEAPAELLAEPVEEPVEEPDEPNKPRQKRREKEQSK